MITHKISFSFDGRETEDIHKINEILKQNKFSELTLVDFDGYLAKTTAYNNNYPAVSYRYGFDRAILEGKITGEETSFYQVDTVVKENEEGLTDRFHEIWSAEHPDKCMRYLACVSFENQGMMAFVVLYEIT